MFQKIREKLSLIHIDKLSLFGTGFLVTALVAAVSVTSNPIKSLIFNSYARYSADAIIRQKERTGACTGRCCLDPSACQADSTGNLKPVSTTTTPATPADLGSALGGQIVRPANTISSTTPTGSVGTEDKSKTGSGTTTISATGSVGAGPSAGTGVSSTTTINAGRTTGGTSTGSTGTTPATGTTAGTDKTKTTSGSTSTSNLQTTGTANAVVTKTTLSDCENLANKNGDTYSFLNGTCTLHPPTQSQSQSAANELLKTTGTSTGLATNQTGTAGTANLNTSEGNQLQTTGSSGTSPSNIAEVTGTANLPTTTTKTTQQLNVTSTVGTGAGPLTISNALPRLISTVTTLFAPKTEKNTTINATGKAVGVPPTNTTQVSGSGNPIVNFFKNIINPSSRSNTASVSSFQSGTKTISVAGTASGGNNNFQKFISAIISPFQKLGNLVGSTFSSLTGKSTSTAIVTQTGSAAKTANLQVQPTTLDVNPATLTRQGNGQGTCADKGYCDGTRMYELYKFYASQTDGWWYHDGKFTPKDFLAMMIMGESLGSSDPATARATATAIAEAVSNQLGGSSELFSNGIDYCPDAKCQNGAGIFNFLGAYSLSAWLRYDSLLDYNSNQSAKTLSGLKDQQLADYFSKNGLSLSEISNQITANIPNDTLNSPTDWGCRGCGDPGLKWISTADKCNATVGTTNPNGVFYEGKDGEVVYTRNQAAFWTSRGGKCP